MGMSDVLYTCDPANLAGHVTMLLMKESAILDTCNSANLVGSATRLIMKESAVSYTSSLPGHAITLLMMGGE